MFLGDSMCMVAHSVGNSTIGLLDKLNLDSVYRGCAWRAMLLKDSEGDVGVLVAGWTGAKPGVPGIPGTRHRRGVPGVPAKPGACKFTYLDLRDHVN